MDADAARRRLTMSAHGPASLFADISSNDSAFNAHAYRSAGHRVIAIKATEGVSFTNPHYAAWVAAAHAAGLAVIHYHFCRPENLAPIGQADHFWNTVAPHYHHGPDRLALDLETGHPNSVAGWLATSDAHLHDRSGETPVAYTYLSYLNEAGGALKIGSKRWWIAAWGNQSPPAKLPGGQQLWAWQNTDGRLGGDPKRHAGVIGSAPGGGGDGSILNRRSLGLMLAQL